MRRSPFPAIIPWRTSICAAIRPDWDTYFLGICHAVAERADCTRRKIGAVIIKDHRIVSTGYNGAPAGHFGCLEGACPRGRLTPEEQPHGGTYQDCIAVHAEANAIIYGDYERMLHGTIYITDHPCGECLKLIMGAGILRVVTPDLAFSIPQHGWARPASS
jgi:dCMP deaminase